MIGYSDINFSENEINNEDFASRLGAYKVALGQSRNMREALYNIGRVKRMSKQYTGRSRRLHGRANRTKDMSKALGLLRKAKHSNIKHAFKNPVPRIMSKRYEIDPYSYIRSSSVLGKDETLARRYNFVNPKLRKRLEKAFKNDMNLQINPKDTYSTRLKNFVGKFKRPKSPKNFPFRTRSITEDQQLGLPFTSRARLTHVDRARLPFSDRIRLSPTDRLKLPYYEPLGLPYVRPPRKRTGGYAKGSYRDLASRHIMELGSIR